MFGKKNSSGGSKPKKAKSPKSTHDVNFFAAHAEKLVLGVVVLMLSYLVYDGVGGKGYDPQRDPTKLSSDAEQLINSIRNGDPWPAIEKERIVEHNFAKRTDEARHPSDPSLYPVPILEVQDKGAYEKRGDPELLAPIKVIGQSVVGLLAVEAADNWVDPLEDYPDADKLKSKKKKKDNPSRNMYNAEGMTSDAASMAGMAGDVGGAPVPTKRMFPQQYNKGYTLGLQAADSMGMGMGMAGEATAGMPMAGPATTNSSSLTGGPAVKPKKYRPKPVFMNVVTALVPHEELLKEYEDKLRESASYSPMRDRPIYLSFEVQRAQVKPNQPIQETDWARVTDATDQLNKMKDWANRIQRTPDVIDPTAAEGALTMPLPPMLIHDIRKHAKHPDIDWVWDAGIHFVQPAADPNAPKNDPQEDTRLPGERMMMPGMGMPGMSGDSTYSSGTMDSGMNTGMGMGMGMTDPYAMTGDSGMGMQTAMQIAPPKYKMIRFYDEMLPTDISKTFAYRVRVMLDDPNYPSDHFFPAPPNSELKDEVFARIQPLRKVEDPKAEQIKQDNLKLRPGQLPKVFNRTKRWTPWSEASNPVFVRGTEDFYFHKIIKKQDDPESEAVLVKLDLTKNAYVPFYPFKTETLDEEKKVPLKLKRGTMMFGSIFAQFAHPITGIMKQDKAVKDGGTRFMSTTTVIDVRYNKEDQAYSKKTDDPLDDIAEIMVLMNDGRVEVSNEFDDAFWYRAFTSAEDRETADKSGGDAQQAVPPGGGV